MAKPRKVTLTKESEEISDAYYLTFGAGHGSMVLKDLVKRFGGDTYVPGDQTASNVRMGERRVILKILQIINRKNAQPLTEEAV